MFKITVGIKISVETSYQPGYSNPLGNDFMFSYKITIENTNDFPVKLLSRHWNIFDSNGTSREVHGDGVVGIRPLLNPGEQYQYVSGCNLKTEIGKMQGSYLFENINNGKKFHVVIPTFQMSAPFKLN